MEICFLFSLYINTNKYITSGGFKDDALGAQVPHLRVTSRNTKYYMY